MGCNNSNQR